MIKPNELRIGNYFDIISRKGNVYLPMGIAHQISKVGLFDVELGGIDPSSENIITRNIKDLSPVPLTEELLLKCRFKFTYAIDYDFCELTINNSIKLRTDDSINYERVFLQYSNLELGVDVKYLHQLQNLYFTLTNKELEINL